MCQVLSLPVLSANSIDCGARHLKCVLGFISASTLATGIDCGARHLHAGSGGREEEED